MCPEKVKQIILHPNYKYCNSFKSKNKHTIGPSCFALNFIVSLIYKHEQTEFNHVVWHLNFLIIDFSYLHAFNAIEKCALPSNRFLIRNIMKFFNFRFSINFKNWFDCVIMFIIRCHHPSLFYLSSTRKI